jgi:hypothetical protein
VSIAKKHGAKDKSTDEPKGAEIQSDENHTASGEGGEANGSTEPVPGSPAKESTQLLAGQPATEEGADRESRTLNFVIKAPPKASFIKMIHKGEMHDCTSLGNVVGVTYQIFPSFVVTYP